MKPLAELYNERDRLVAELEATESKAKELRSLIGDVVEKINAGMHLERIFAHPPEQELCAKLTALREALARKLRRRPFGVFDDHVLERIVAEKPLTQLALHRVNGMSAQRVKDFGDEIVGCVLAVLKPGQPLPHRPYFEPCSFCNKLQVLVDQPPPGFKCSECLNSTDPRAHRPNLSIKLPTARDFD